MLLIVYLMSFFFQFTMSRLNVCSIHENANFSFIVVIHFHLKSK